MKLITKSPAKITNKEGKQRRANAKKILIGMIYGRGPGSIAEQIGVPLEEGKQIVENFKTSFPTLTQWMNDIREKTKKLGYVDDILGRRRHLPNALLPKYQLENLTPTLNPFLNCSNEYIDPQLKEKYEELLNNCKSKKELDSIIQSAKKENIAIINNQGKIAQAMREAPHWCCQAQTASWIKMNMIAIDNDPILKKLGGKLLLTIHDEVQLEAPRENAEKVKERLEWLMSNTCKDLICIPLPSDGLIEWSGGWYVSEEETLINAHFNEYVNKGMTKEDAYKRICEEECQLNPESIYNFLFKGEYLKY